MKKQFSITLKDTFFVLFLVFSFSAFAQDFAMHDYSKRDFKVPFRAESEFTMNGIWSVFDDCNNLEKIEIYDRNCLIEVKSDEEAHVFWKNLLAEKLEKQAGIERLKMQTLYDDYDYVSDKKIILDCYKIVVMELLFQSKEMESYLSVEQIALELKILNEKVAKLVYKNTLELENQLKKCHDIEEIKSLLLN